MIMSALSTTNTQTVLETTYNEVSLERAFDVTVIEPVLYFRYVNVFGEELDPLDKYNIPGEEALPSRFPSRSTG